MAGRERIKVKYRNHICYILHMRRVDAYPVDDNDNRWLCPLCNKMIQVGDEMKLFFNNYNLFPNIAIHDACMHSTPEKTVQEIYCDYLKYKSIKSLLENYKVWDRFEN